MRNHVYYCINCENYLASDTLREVVTCGNCQFNKKGVYTMILQEQQLIPLVCDKCHRAEAGSMILIGEECGAIDIRVCIGRLKLDSSKEL